MFSYTKFKLVFEKYDVKSLSSAISINAGDDFQHYDHGVFYG